MVKKAVYLGKTLEWSENGLSVRPDRRHVHSLLREVSMESCRSISTPLCAHCGEGNRSDRPEQEAVYLGTSLEWGGQGFGVRPDERHVRSLLRELVMENCRSVSTPLSLTVEKGRRSE